MSRENNCNRLMTFVAPQPNRLMIAATSFINRMFMFNHVPVLDRVPGLNRIPGITGITRIKKIDLPASDSVNFEEAVNEQTVAFIAPNHPEFFVDWMIDKALSTRFSPLMASWATHAIVNGMGRVAQWFWLKNNLIAQIPGAGGAAGKKFSVEWALKGHAVLLHPEGQVGWHSDHIAPLFPGVVEMAFEAADQTCRTTRPRQVHIAPVVWKMQFIGDVSAALHREMAYVEKRLKLTNGAHLSIEKRVAAAQHELLSRAEKKWGRDTTGEGLSYGVRHAFLMDSLLRVVEARFDLIGAPLDPGLPRNYRTRLESTGRYTEFAARLRRAEKVARARCKAGKAISEDTDRAIKTLQKLGMFAPELYTAPTLTQEHLAESIKRIRQVYCRGTFRDEMNAMLPIAAGSRIAHVRVAAPLNINAYWMKTVDASADKIANVKQSILDELARSLDTALQALAQELDAQRTHMAYENPFIA